ICEPELDAIAVRVKSPLLKSRRIAIQIRFPYGTGETVTADWGRADAHETILVQPEPNQAGFTRKLDNDVYFAAANWTKGATLTNTARHQFEVVPGKNADELEVTCEFSPVDLKPRGLKAFEQVKRAARENWSRFWQTGGAIDLSGSKDPR